MENCLPVQVGPGSRWGVLAPHCKGKGSLSLWLGPRLMFIPKWAKWSEGRRGLVGLEGAFESGPKLV